jgi:hypothetical protein
MADVQDHRRHPRFPVALPATVSASIGQSSALIYDIACGGAMIETTLLLLPRMRASIRCGTINVEGLVAWKRGRRTGIAFDRELGEREVIEQMDRSHAIASRRLNQKALRAANEMIG